jgi:hypothetical protein
VAAWRRAPCPIDGMEKDSVSFLFLVFFQDRQAWQAPRARSVSPCKIRGWAATPFSHFNGHGHKGSTDIRVHLHPDVRQGWTLGSLRARAGSLLQSCARALSRSKFTAGESHQRATGALPSRAADICASRSASASDSMARACTSRCNLSSVMQ